MSLTQNKSLNQDERIQGVYLQTGEEKSLKGSDFLHSEYIVNWDTWNAPTYILTLTKPQKMKM